jgi:hypothetical protein
VLWERGLDVRDTPLWELGFVVDADAVSVREATQTGATVTARPPDGDPLVAHVDADLAITVIDD